MPYNDILEHTSGKKSRYSITHRLIIKPIKNRRKANNKVLVKISFLNLLMPQNFKWKKKEFPSYKL